MSNSRYTRDEIISQGLDLAGCSSVSQHDMPGGVVDPNAHAIKWLQNSLDMFHRKYPFSTDIQDIALTLPANSVDSYLTGITPTTYLPSNFILDVRNGIEATLDSRTYRLRRKSYQYWLEYKLGTQNRVVRGALYYTIVNKRIKVLPLLSEAQSAILHYYALPELLKAEDTVSFPDEWSLIEFVRLKALEYVRAIEPGTAQGYLMKQLSGLRSSGLLNEPEYEDAIPIEDSMEVSRVDRNSWMGPAVRG